MKERESEERLEENQSKLRRCKYGLYCGSSYDGKLQICMVCTRHLCKSNCCDKKEIKIELDYKLIEYNSSLFFHW